MNEQHQHAAQPREPRLAPAGAEPTDSGERLAAARVELDRIYAAADAILDRIRLANNERFLEQVRQSGGQ
jgi:hypothetical protein